jgi:hypothetical protein
MSWCSWRPSVMSPKRHAAIKGFVANLEEDEQYYHFLLSTQPTQKTALLAFGTRFR